MDVKFSVPRHLLWTQLRATSTYLTSWELLSRCQKNPPICDFTEWTARSYLKFLERFGYTTAEMTPGECKRWRLVPEMNTGLLAPMAFREGIYDPNHSGPVLMAGQRIWNALRAEGNELSIREATMRASCDRAFCRKYLLLLQKAGVVEGAFDGPSKHYRFCRKVGPYHLPQLGTDKLFDQEKNKIITL